jgi:hypothetical protein
MTIAVACSSKERAPRGPAAPPPAAEPNGNFTLYVSNQSFDRPAVDISITIDGASVAGRVFDVGNQHNWSSFELNLKPGAHAITAISTRGGAQLETNFTTGARHWAVVDYWCCSNPTDPHFSFTISDRPIGFG